MWEKEKIINNTDEEPFVLVLPIFFGQRHGKISSETLQGNFVKEHERYLESMRVASCLEASFDTVRYVVTNFDNYSLEPLVLPANMGRVEKLEFDVKEATFSNEALDSLVLKQYTPEIVQAWTLQNEELWQAKNAKPWISIALPCREISDGLDEQGTNQVSSDSLKSSLGQRARRIFLFILFAGLGVFFLKMDGCARIASVLNL